MDLQEEYMKRRVVLGHVIRYPERGTLLLRPRGLQKTEWSSLQVTLTSAGDATHPQNFHFQVAANPLIYSSSNFNGFSYHHQKMILDQRLEWDAYENFVLEWAKSIAPSYEAIYSLDATFVSWLMFCTNYDQWMSSFLPFRLVDQLAVSLEGDRQKRLDAIQMVETWVRERHDQVYSCWKSMKNNYDSRHYADWLAQVVNDIGENTLRPYGAFSKD